MWGNVICQVTSEDFLETYLVNQSIQWINERTKGDPKQPWFLYTSMLSPHPPNWVYIQAYPQHPFPFFRFFLFLSISGAILMYMYIYIYIYICIYTGAGW